MDPRIASAHKGKKTTRWSDHLLAICDYPTHQELIFHQMVHHDLVPEYSKIPVHHDRGIDRQLVTAPAESVVRVLWLIL
jgi:hypothetical protein